MNRTPEDAERLLRSAYDATATLPDHPRARAVPPTDPQRRWLPVAAAAAAVVVVGGVIVTTGSLGRAPNTPGATSPTPLPTGTAVTTPPPGTPDDRLWSSRGMVIQDGDAIPRLCFVVRQSLPPQCGSGIDLRGWDWAAVTHETQGSTRWGEYNVVGTYDTAFTLRQTPTPAAEGSPEPRPAPAAPCPAPDGGWRVLDPTKVAATDQQATAKAAAALDGFGGIWVAEPHSVLTVAVTTDLSGAETTLRRTWGGPLCVTTAQHTAAELAAIAESLTEPAADTLSITTAAGRVELTVVVDRDGAVQKDLDNRYGAGTVTVASMLRPFGATQTPTSAAAVP